MLRLAIILTVVAVVAINSVSTISDTTSAQDKATDLEGHPLVGTWLFDTDLTSDANPPELGMFLSDGIYIGLGSSESAGSWVAGDSGTGNVTLVSRFDDGGGGYAVIRGPHVVDAAGETWICDCTITVVAADGMVLDSFPGASRGVRIPVEPADAMGTPLAGAPTWFPAAAATPAP